MTNSSLNYRHLLRVGQLAWRFKIAPYPTKDRTLDIWLRMNESLSLHNHTIPLDYIKKILCHKSSSTHQAVRGSPLDLIVLFTIQLWGRQGQNLCDTTSLFLKKEWISVYVCTTTLFYYVKNHSLLYTSFSSLMHILNLNFHLLWSHIYI